MARTSTRFPARRRYKKGKDVTDFRTPANWSPPVGDQFCSHGTIQLPPMWSILARQQEPRFPVAEFFIKGNSMIHQFVQAGGQVSSCQEGKTWSRIAQMKSFSMTSSSSGE
jgi:hypothetical protein